MKPWIVILALTAALLAVIAAMEIASNVEVTPAAVIESVPTVIERPEEPISLGAPPELDLPREDLIPEGALEVTSDDVNALRTRMIGELADEFRQNIDTEIGRSVSSFELDKPETQE